MINIYIFAISRDDGLYSDPDASIDKYYYWENQQKYYSLRQELVNRVKSKEVTAYTYPNNTIGAKCEVRKSEYGVEYLKTVPNSKPEDNLSSLPEYS